MLESIRILIVDDHAVVRAGLRALLATEPGMEIVGEAADGLEAVAQARSSRPDVILADLVMPRSDGIVAIGEITRENHGVRILVLTSFAEDEKIFPAIKAGAVGYLLKDSSPQDLIQAIRSVHRGELSLHPAMARKLIRELSQPSRLPPTETPLTHQEVQVLTWIAQGLPSQEIAETLVISEKMVRMHVRNILNKLHLAGREQVALRAPREGLI